MAHFFSSFITIQSSKKVEFVNARSRDSFADRDTWLDEKKTKIKINFMNYTYIYK